LEKNELDSIVGEKSLLRKIFTMIMGLIADQNENCDQIKQACTLEQLVGI